jgi:DtxR family transcriptional regulator, Mn-dependent transcriptional regulator
MMNTIADENYLKEIYLLGLNQSPVTTSDLADRFGYAPATVTGMLKKLDSQGWIRYTPYQGAVLTEIGREVALKVIRRHRLVETFLVRTLGVPWEKVHDEAEHMEHAISDYLEDRIDIHLGRPAVNPHGAPIPTRSGEIISQQGLPLSNLLPGDEAEIVEISDAYPDLLIYLEQSHVLPGMVIRIQSVSPFDQIITIESGGSHIVLGQKSASQIRVNKIPGV